MQIKTIIILTGIGILLICNLIIPIILEFINQRRK